MTTINVYKLLKTDCLMTSEVGIEFCNRMIQLLSSKNQIVLDFSNIKNISSTFIRYSFGRLLKKKNIHLFEFRSTFIIRGLESNEIFRIEQIIRENYLADNRKSDNSKTTLHSTYLQAV